MLWLREDFGMMNGNGKQQLMQQCRQPKRARANRMTAGSRKQLLKRTDARMSSLQASSKQQSMQQSSHPNVSNFVNRLDP
jgi:hypothetical protein